jgi:multidrug resistance protein MdtO
MASIAQAVPSLNSSLVWFWEFLKDELAPYRGRVALVTRIVVASTLFMVISMVFRLPYGAYGAVFAITLSRESLEATASAARIILIAFALAGAFVMLGLMLALDDPALRFCWIVTGFLIGFWALSALRSYTGAARFGYLIAVTVTLWDRHVPANSKVESGLWAVGVITLASYITLALEIAFKAFRKTTELTEAIAERLSSVEELLTHCGAGDDPNSSIRATLDRLAMTGTSGLRRTLRRSSSDPQYAAEMGAVVGLTGRLVDLAANLPRFSGSVSEIDRERLGRVARRIREIREDVIRGSVLPASGSAQAEKIPPGLPLLGEIEDTVALIGQAFTGSRQLDVFAPSPSADQASSSSLIRGALLDPEHLKFALRGCLAATACYVIFNALFWPEISTSVTTCFLTALTTIGASRQKQILRFAGAIIGGFVIGMGAQIFILPHIDSIAGFVALYIAVIAGAAWVITSSARISYLGVQLATTFCLINLQEFKFQTSLTVARDRVVGVLLGLFMMWLFFDHLWSTPAGLEMRRTFASALRLLGRLARAPVSNDLQKAVEDTYVLRDEINAKFDRVRSLADSVLFEFGPSRSSDLEFRALIRRWTPQFRALFLMRIASLKYRLKAPGFELPEAVRLRQEAYDDVSARMLEQMADRIEKPVSGTVSETQELQQLLDRRLEDTGDEARRGLPVARAESLLTLLHGIDSLTNSLAKDVDCSRP